MPAHLPAPVRPCWLAESNRLRDALLHVYPALERLLGRHMDRSGVLDVLAAASTPQALAALGEDGIAQLTRARSPRLAKTLPAHGGRRARMRGTLRIGADFSLLAAATNLARLAKLGLVHSCGGWTLNPA